MKKLIILLAIPFIISCSSTKTIKFSQKADDIVTTQSLKEFLINNKTPKVVLRVPRSTYSVTDSEKNENIQVENKDYLYGAIENQLLASGFIVRDRQLFNQIIGNDENNIDYKKLKEKSDTDLIIELTKLDTKIIYETNNYYDKKNKLKVENYGTHKEYGASVEFKIVLINSNEFAGVYKFNYTPCVDGCIISKSLKDIQKEMRLYKKKGVTPYEGVEKNIMEDFIKNATFQLVTEMRK
ncbi:hypothetical protein MHL31_12500 [Lutibacter sp. A80]|uniref:hypothetical protein n=1 Tax=Lutibacter sp. A80 TaxID=2918453 RepID=UPI001F06F7A3|nr:hypothetical protein [Lutibacter sp. A80]UMB59890.1 hypothetical protein MHL31_12500 [Lutibacter sp. A80]